MSTALSAANAYAAISKATAQKPSNPIENGSAAGGNFAKLVNQAVESTLEAGKNSDQATMAMATGQQATNMVDVVTAVAETELALQTMVSVRDRVISAYEEIMRMPI